MSSDQTEESPARIPEPEASEPVAEPEAPTGPSVPATVPESDGKHDVASPSPPAA
jgi:hypothetical protein